MVIKMKNGIKIERITTEKITDVTKNVHVCHIMDNTDIFKKPSVMSSLLKFANECAQFNEVPKPTQVSTAAPPSNKTLHCPNCGSSNIAPNRPSDFMKSPSTVFSFHCLHCSTTSKRKELIIPLGLKASLTDYFKNDWNAKALAKERLCKYNDEV